MARPINRGRNRNPCFPTSTPPIELERDFAISVRSLAFGTQSVPDLAAAVFFCFVWSRLLLGHSRVQNSGILSRFLWRKFLCEFVPVELKGAKVVCRMAEAVERKFFRDWGQLLPSQTYHKHK